MKKITLLIAFIGMIALQGCTGPQGPQGVPGQNGKDGLLSEVFELRNINFDYNSNIGYNIHEYLNPNIYASDNILIYIRTGFTDNTLTVPVWQQIPRTVQLTQGDLYYDFDFSQKDFYIYAWGNYNLSLTPNYLNNQTFRIVIIPGFFSNKMKTVDTSDYNAVIKAYNIDDSRVKIIN